MPSREVKHGPRNMTVSGGNERICLKDNMIKERVLSAALGYSYLCVEPD